MILVALSGLFLPKKIWLMGSTYCLIAITCLLIITRQGARLHRGIFDLMADLHGLMGSTNQLMFIVVGIPFIVTLVSHFFERNERGMSVVKLGSRFRTWHVHVISAICLSFILTCLILVISFLIGGCLVGLENTWLSRTGTVSKILHNKGDFQSVLTHLSTYKIILTLFITKLLGFMMISFLTLFFKQFIKSSALIMIIFIALAGIDQLSSLPIPFFTRMASLTIKNWLDPMITIYHSLYFFIVSLILYGLTGFLYERKDFLS